MNPIFVSYAHEDQSFVSLLTVVLQYHHVPVWTSDVAIEPGTPFGSQIDTALSDADHLLVVVSSKTARSKYVTKEVAVFEARKPGARVIPLVLEPTNLDRIIDGLSARQWIDFGSSMLGGFRQLLDVFDKVFLPAVERRSNPQRRSNPDRRQALSRRAKEARYRLEYGLWSSYSSREAIGKFDRITVDTHRMHKAMDAVRPEVVKYLYIDAQGLPHDPDRVLEEAATQAWTIMRSLDFSTIDRSGGLIGTPAIYLIQAMADEIRKRYSVVPRGERRHQDRRTSSERRM